MTKMHFVSAHFGGPVPWEFEVKSPSIEVTTAYYNDWNTPSRHLAMHPRLKSKIPKMLEWRFVDSDWYVWIDSSLKLNNKFSDLPAQILKLAGDNPLVLFKHTAAESIRDEAKRVLHSMANNHEYLIKRYSGEPILEQVIHYHGDPDFVDNQLFATGFFAYHRRAAPMLQEWFNHTVTWSLQCQISFPYVLQKSGLGFSLFEGIINGDNPYVTWHWQEREKNLYR